MLMGEMLGGEGAKTLRVERDVDCQIRRFINRPFVARARIPGSLRCRIEVGRSLRERGWAGRRGVNRRWAFLLKNCSSAVPIVRFGNLGTGPFPVLELAAQILIGIWYIGIHKLAWGDSSRTVMTSIFEERWSEWADFVQG